MFACRMLGAGRDHQRPIDRHLKSFRALAPRRVRTRRSGACQRTATLSVPAVAEPRLPRRCAAVPPRGRSPTPVEPHRVRHARHRRCRVPRLDLHRRCHVPRRERLVRHPKCRDPLRGRRRKRVKRRHAGRVHALSRSSGPSIDGTETEPRFALRETHVSIAQRRCGQACRWLIRPAQPAAFELNPGEPRGVTLRVFDGERRDETASSNDVVDRPAQVGF